MNAYMSSVLRYTIDDVASSFKFSDRLARENMWSKEYTLRVIEEYKKFMYLCAKFGNMTPSLDVDECWHLHLLYTADYWGLFREVLGKDIHHGPTKGGKAEDVKFGDYYAKTLDLYHEEFGHPAPADIWPPAVVRFRPVNFVRVDARTHWIVPVGDLKALFRLIFKTIKTKLWP